MTLLYCLSYRNVFVDENSLTHCLVSAWFTGIDDSYEHVGDVKMFKKRRHNGQSPHLLLMLLPSYRLESQHKSHRQKRALDAAFCSRYTVCIWSAAECSPQHSASAVSIDTHLSLVKHSQTSVQDYVISGPHIKADRTTYQSRPDLIN